MPLSGMLTCGGCGVRTQMGQMRYNLSGTKLICQDCVQKERSSIKPGTTHSTSLRLQREQMSPRGIGGKIAETVAEAAELRTGKGGAGSGEGPDTVRYYCRSCHFKFSRKKEVEIVTCPYCGRQTLSLAYEGKAQDLIEEATRAEEGMF